MMTTREVREYAIDVWVCGPKGTTTCARISRHHAGPDGRRKSSTWTCSSQGGLRQSNRDQHVSASIRRQSGPLCARCSAAPNALYPVFRLYTQARGLCGYILVSPTPVAGVVFLGYVLLRIYLVCICEEETSRKIDLLTFNKLPSSTTFLRFINH